MFPMIKVLYWYCRGIGNDSTRRVLRDLCLSHHPSLVCIAEPMVDFDSVVSSFWSSMGLSLVGVNDKQI